MKQSLVFALLLTGLAGGAYAQGIVAEHASGKVIATARQADADALRSPRTGAQPGSVPIRRIGPSGSTVRGYMSYRDVENFTPGFYEINTFGQTTRLWDYEFADQYANLRGLWYRNGKLCGYAVIAVGGDDLIAGLAYQEIEPLTGKVTKSTLLNIDENLMPYMTSCAYNPADDYIYGFGKTGNSETEAYAFKRAKASNPAEVEVVRNLDAPMERCPSFCYSPVDKCFYGVTIDGKFVKMDTAGKATELFVAPVDKLGTSTGALAFSPFDGCLLWNPTVYSTNSALYAVYPDERRVELLKAFDVDQQFTSFVTDDVAYDTQAPARPRITAVNFDGPALSGSVDFTIPSELYDGTAISTPVKWSLKGNGTELASGSAAAGQSVNQPLADLPQGDYTFRVEASIDGHTGYPAVAHRYVGHDTPLAPDSVALIPDSIIWTPVFKGVHNGYLDLANITYEVWLNDRKLGETASTKYAYSLAPEDPMAAYRARVYAVAHDMKSEAAESKKLVMGKPYDLPYTMVPTAEQADLVVTENRDGSPAYGEWRFVEDWGGVSCFASGWSYEKPDDWLILPAVNIPDNKVAYKVTVSAARGSSIGSREYFEIWVGTEPNAASMTIPVLAKTRPRNRNWEDYSNVFAVPRAGKYYVAIHGCSDPDMKDLIVRNIRVEATQEPTAVPASVADLKVSSTSDADLTATVSFRLPDKYINGTAIPSDAPLKTIVKCVSETEVSGAPGDSISATVSTAQGDNVISVYCVAGTLEGQSSEVTTFTGQDLLSYVENYKATLSEDNMSAHLTWEAPIESLNGGYFSKTGIKYWIAEILTDGSIVEGTEPVLAGTDVFEYDYTLPAGTPQAYRRIAVIAENAAGLSPARWFAGFAMGTPYSLPMTENWTDLAPAYQPLRVTASGAYQNGSWTFGQPELVNPAFAHPSNKYTLIGYTDAESARVRITLPKFATDKGEKAIRASFDFFTGEMAARDITILASSWNTAPEVVAKVPAGKGWSIFDLIIPAKFMNRPWVDLAIDGFLDSSENFLLLSNYSISDVSAVGTIGEEASVLSYSGGVLSGRGMALTVADVSGVTLLKGRDSLDLSGLAPGIYIVTGSDGAIHRTLKIRIR